MCFNFHEHLREFTADGGKQNSLNFVQSSPGLHWEEGSTGGVEMTRRSLPPAASENNLNILQNYQIERVF